MTEKKLSDFIKDAYVAKEAYDYICSTNGFSSREAFDAYIHWQNQEQQVHYQIDRLVHESNSELISALMLFDIIPDDE